MSEETKINIPSVTVWDLENIAKKIKETTDSAETEISFEFLLASLFPTCWNNIQAELGRQYALGYMAGQEDYRKEVRERAIKEMDCYCE